MVDEHARLSGDGEGEWVHLDPDRAAAESDFGGTIVQGFLQVSHLVKLHGEAMRSNAMVDMNFSLNYGFDRLRFVLPLPVGAKFRARVRPLGMTEKPGGGHVLKNDVRLELEDGRPTLLAEWLFYLDPRALRRNGGADHAA
jgi:acyl dehydratase